MLFRKMIGILSVLALLSVLMFGCKIESEPETMVTPTVLEVFNLGDDSYIEVSEVEPGEMAVVAQVKDMSMIEGLEGKDPVEVCKYYNGGVVPEAVQAAYDVVVESRKQGVNKADQAVDCESANVAADSKMTASAFASSYCTSGWNYAFCWLNRTSNAYVQRGSCYSMYSYINAYRGNVMHVLKYYSSGWKTYASLSCLQGWITYIGHWGSRRGRRAELNEGSGDGWHFAIHGSN
jgi:hypothetical protein